MTSYAALPEELKSAVGLLVAFALGTAIGAERQYRQRTAGLRTAVLVAVGACAFVDLGMRLTGPDGGTRTVAYVISGIGFLGAGVIMKEGMNVRGLNTAATLWCSAAVGAFCGADLPLEAVFVMVAVLACNTALRPLVNAINRAPIRESATEATYEVQVTTSPGEAGPAQDLLVERLEAANYPVGSVAVEERGETAVDVVATLTASAVKAEELDAVTADLARAPGIRHATWSVQTADDFNREHPRLARSYRNPPTGHPGPARNGPGSAGASGTPVHADSPRTAGGLKSNSQDYLRHELDRDVAFLGPNSPAAALQERPIDGVEGPQGFKDCAMITVIIRCSKTNRVT